MSVPPGYLVIKDWEDHQHYKNRNPPWIKLHYELLDNYAFAALEDGARSHLMLIWLLASRHGGRVPNDAEWISRKIGARGRLNLQVLIEAGFLVVAQADSVPLASPKQMPIAEIEAEAEREAEKETTARAPASRVDNNTEPATTAGQVMAAVRKHLWHPDGLPPPDYSDGREMSVIRALMERESGADLIRAVHGLLLLQREGEVDWIGPGKITLRAVYNSKNGSRDMLTQALDAYARGSPEAHAPKKSGQRRADAVRADFILANERIKRGLA